jgi:hypothetical protein
MIEIGSLFGALFLGFISDKTFSKRSPVALLSVIVTSIILINITYNY